MERVVGSPEVKETGTGDNLKLYNEVREVPKDAQKIIGGGRLKGMTDINPMWRIKTLTEKFGVCGFGWKIEEKSRWIEQGANGEATANVEILLYVKINGEWSDGIFGVGGSSFISKTKNGLETSDECFKMATTDAISVACKMLGFGADIYWGQDKTKYDQQEQDNNNAQQGNASKSPAVQKLQSIVKNRLDEVEKTNEERMKELIGKSKYANCNWDDLKEYLKGRFGREISVNEVDSDTMRDLCEYLIKLSHARGASNGND